MATGTKTWLGGLRWGIFLWAAILTTTLVTGFVVKSQQDATAQRAVSLAADVAQQLNGLERIDLSPGQGETSEDASRRYRALGSTFLHAYAEAEPRLARKALDVGGADGVKLALLFRGTPTRDDLEAQSFALEPANRLREKLMALRTRLGQAQRLVLAASDKALQSRSQSTLAFWSVWFSLFGLGLTVIGLHAKKRWTAIDVSGQEMTVELERYGTYLQLIDSAHRITQTAETTEACLGRLVSEYGRIAGWDLGHVLTPTPAGGLTTLGTWFCVQEEGHVRLRRITESITFARGQDLPGEALASKSPVWYETLHDCATSQRFRVAGDLDLKSGFAFPIIAKDEVVAVIELFDVSQRAPEEQLLEVTAIVCALVASLFEREQAAANAEEILSTLRAHQTELEMQQHLIDVQQASLNEQRLALDEIQNELATEKAIHAADLAVRVEERSGSGDNGLQDLYAMAARRFEELFHGVPVACFTCDTNGTIFEWNSAAQDLWGYIAPQILEKSAYKLLFPDNGEADLEGIFKRVFAGEPVENLEVECVDMTGRRFWVLGSLFPTRGSGKSITGAVWSCVDISERMAMEEKLRESEELIRTSMESMQSGVMMFAPNATVQMVNPRMCELLWMSHKTLVAEDFRFEQLRPLDADGHVIPTDELPLYRSLRTGEKCQDVVMGIRRVDGGVVWFSVSSAPIAINNEAGERSVVMSFADITMKMASERTMLASLREVQLYSSELEQKAAELAYVNAKLENLATTDGLTGLKNQRAFQEALEQQFQTAVRHGEPLAVLLLDVDHFKQYNDTFGHPAGDDVLRELADILNQQSRATDVVARYGGEEFVMILPHTDAPGALELAERVRTAVETSRWPNRPVTVSVGVASFLPTMAMRSELVEAADSALYASKASGRNRVTVWEPQPKAA